MFGLIIIFLLTNGNLTTSKIFIYPTQSSCEKELTNAELYQRGVHSTDGIKLVGFCMPVEADKTGSST